MPSDDLRTDSYPYPQTPHKTRSWIHDVWIIMLTLVADSLCYGIIIPLIAIYYSGAFVSFFELSRTVEIATTAFLTFTLVQCGYCIAGERSYWKSLFAQDHLFIYTLKMRDLLNSILIVITVYCLYSTIEDMIADKSMKKSNLGEGTSYFFIKTFCAWGDMDKSLLTLLGINPPHKGTLLDPDFGENARLEHAAGFMFYWAVLASCVGKLVYYNSLYTYLDTLKVFLSMDPTFDDGYESPTSSCNVCTNND